MFENWFSEVAAALSSALITWWITRLYTTRARVMEIDDPAMMVYIEGGFREAVAAAKDRDAVHIVDVWNKGRSPLIDVNFDIIESGNLEGIVQAGIVYYAGRSQKPIVNVVKGRITVSHPYLAPNQQMRLWVISTSHTPLQLHCPADEISTRSRRPRRGRSIPFLN